MDYTKRKRGPRVTPDLPRYDAHGTRTSVHALSGVFYLWIPVNRKAWAPGSEMNLDTKTWREFVAFMAIQYKKELVKAIDTQRFAKKWKPLNVAYLEKKRRMGLSLNIWEATGQLKESIIVIKKRGAWVVGPDPDAYYHRTKPVRILLVAHWLEYGTKRGIPPRPLFRNVTSYMRKHIRDYYIKFCKQTGRKP